MASLLTIADKTSLFKKCLVQLPSKFDYEYCEEARIELRRLLNFAASNDGEYMKFLLFSFKEIQQNNINVSLPESWPHVIVPERYPFIDKPSIYFQRTRSRDLCHPNRTCGAKFVRGEPIYKCTTCSKDDAAGICVNCFDETYHDGHDFLLIICHRENGGVCDCGNDEAWNNNFNCELKDIDQVDESKVPQRLKDALLRTLEISLDYVVDVLSTSYTRLNPVKDTQSILKDAYNSSLEESAYHGTDRQARNYYLMIYDDHTKQYREAIERILLATEKEPEFAQMIADEVDTNGRAKVIRSDKLEYLLEKKKILETTGFPCTIRNAREIFKEDMCLEILEWMSEISVGEIFGNYNIARDLLTKAFCRIWDTGIKHLSKEDSQYPGALQKNNIPNLRRQSRSNQDDLDLMNLQSWKTTPKLWDIDESLSNDCQYNLNFAYWDEHEGAFHGSRFQHLLYLDMRLWKSIRTALHGLLNQILPSNQKYKSVVCAQYVDIYPIILELFFRHDKDAEYNCMASLTAQIFSCKSNATMIVKHGDLTKFLALAHGLLTQEHAVRPCDVSFLPVLKFYGVKNKKISQLFFDVCCILNKSEDIEMLTSDNFFNQICDLLLLFQGRPALKREAHEHVEYESNDFGVFFTMYTVLSTFSEMAARNLKNIPKFRSDQIIRLITERLFNGSHHYELGASGTMKKPLNDMQVFNMRKVNTIDGDTRLTLFRVQDDYISFLHPLHAFLSWCIQYSNVDKDTFHPGTGNFDFDMFDTREIIVEYPLRVMVLLSQIKAGIWVRNGQGMKTQLSLYTDSLLRDTGYKRDLQLIQLAASLYDPNFILSTFINRWCMGSWLTENFACQDNYGKDSMNMMVSEFLLFLLHLLTETEYLDESERLNDLKIKKSIIHALCFEPLTHAKLCSIVPEFLQGDKKFETILKQITIFSGNSSERAGYYKLKDEFFDEVDPYYIHYNTNKSEKAEEVLKKRMAKKLNVKPNETYIKPVMKPINSPIYKGLFGITSMKMFAQFLRSTLKFIDREGPDMNTRMLNLALNLIHVAVEGQELSYILKFADNIWSELITDHNEPFFYESVGSLLYKLLANEEFVEFHPKIRVIFLSLKSKNNLYDSYLSEQVQNYDSTLLLDENLKVKSATEESEFDKKKKLARQRREKIMAKFKKQQTLFSENNSIAAEESQDSTNSDSNMDIDEPESYWKYPEECCILCQMPAANEIFGVLGNVNKSLLSRNIPFGSKYWTLKSFQTAQMDSESSLDRENENSMNQFFDTSHQVNVVGPEFPTKSINQFHPAFSSCGHGMHHTCYLDYSKSTRSKQLQITRTVHEDFESGEIICPLCKSLGNVFMPILWDGNNNKLSDFVCSNWGNDLAQLPKVTCSDPHVVRETLSDLSLYVKDSLLPDLKDAVSGRDAIKEFSYCLYDVYTTVKELTKPILRHQIPRLLAGTISQLEIANRGIQHDSGLVVDLISNHSLISLRILTEFKNTWYSFNAIGEMTAHNETPNRILLMDEAVAKVEILFSAHMFESIEEVDFFEYVVACFKIPHISSNTIYRMAYIYEFIQILASLLANVTDTAYKKFPALFRINTIKPKNPSSFKHLRSLLKALRDNHPLFDNLPDALCDHSTFGPMMFTLITRCITPFLRKLLIWAVGINADYSGTNIEDYSIDDSECEASRLCRLLQLPNIEEMIELFLDKSTFEFHKFKQFVNYVSTTDNDLSFKKMKFPGQYELIHLPTKLDDICTKLLHVHPFFAEKKYKDPAVCLLCGEVVNLQRKTANGNLGECSNHTKNECLYNVGIFLLPEQSSLLLLHRGNGSFYTIPFTDKHGEYESFSKRANALRFSEKRYEYLTKNVWLLNELPNLITRKLDGTLDTGGWETL